MILTRSPYYYNVPFSSDFVTKVEFGISAQYLDDNDVIQAQTYTLEKLRPSPESSNTWIDLSPFVNDFYSHKPIETSGYTAPTCIESRDVVLIAFSVKQIDSLGNDLPSTTEFFNNLEGYGYYFEGQNSVVKKKILLSHTSYKALETGYFIVPLSCDENSPDPLVNGVVVPLNFTNNTQNVLKYLVVPMASYSGGVDISFDGESIYVELIEECKYKVRDVQFLNRYGAIESIHFYKASKESLTTSSESFKNAYTNGVGYDTARHQKKQYNKISNKKINIETGFLNPEYNQTIQELMESEYVWIDGKPINVATSSLEFKTRIIDKLISYSIDFDYAYDEISNV